MPAERTQTLVLIDGHGLAYRMFYAGNQELTTRSGEPTKATYLFTRALLNLLNGSTPPDYLAVSFDTGITFRHALFDAYKGTREKMPDDLHIQIGRIHQILEAFDIPILAAENYEADDVLGTAARLAGEKGAHTLIVTGDRDLLQLVNERTTVQLPGHRAGEVQLFDVAAVRRHYGLMPEQIVDLKALTGDKSDNIPGVPGIGEKTATALLQQYGTLENIYAHLDQIGSERVRKTLADHRETAFLSYQLARIATDVPLNLDLAACRIHTYDRARVVQLFQELEFHSLLKELPVDNQPAPGTQLPLFGQELVAEAISTKLSTPTHTHIIQDEDILAALIEKLAAASGIALDTETTGLNEMQAKLVGISLAVEPGEAFYIPVGHTVEGSQQLSLELVIERLRPVLTDPRIPKYGHNLKFDAIVLAEHGLEVSPLTFDTLIAAWLSRPDASAGSLGLKSLAFSLMGIEMTEITDLIGKGSKQITFDRVPIAVAASYAGADADVALQLIERLRSDLAKEGVERVFFEVEMPLVPVLIDMQRTGVLVDVSLLRQMSAEVGQTLADLKGRIFEIVGQEFNINSTQQLSKVLFDKIGLRTEGLKKTASGHYSTAAGVLESLRKDDKSGVIDLLLEYRELEKLRSTYLDALPGMVLERTGRIHSSFNQIGAVTGRLSSSEPNLQNIPIRTEVGRQIRDAFIAAPGCLLIGADYSQVELRILAHISGDRALRQAFQEEQDIHATTAAAIFNVPLDQVTAEQRSFAKSVNFGLIYGMGAFRLSQDSGLSLADAERFIAEYFARFPGVKEYLEQTKHEAHRTGSVQTLLGRRGRFPKLLSKETTRQALIDRQAAERAAINMPIQGTAADIIKIAMAQLYHALHAQGLGAKIILQIHDELILEAPEAEAEATAALVKQVMENAYPLEVPLRADVHIGSNWGVLK